MLYRKRNVNNPVTLSEEKVCIYKPHVRIEYRKCTLRVLAIQRATVLVCYQSNKLIIALNSLNDQCEGVDLRYSISMHTYKVWPIQWKELQLKVCHTQRNLFEILLNRTQITLYLPFSDWFGTRRKSVWCQINWKIVNTIWFRFDIIRFRKDFSV